MAKLSRSTILRCAAPFGSVLTSFALAWLCIGLESWTAWLNLAEFGLFGLFGALILALVVSCLFVRAARRDADVTVWVWLAPLVVSWAATFRTTLDWLRMGSASTCDSPPWHHILYAAALETFGVRVFPALVLLGLIGGLVVAGREPALADRRARLLVTLALLSASLELVSGLLIESFPESWGDEPEFFSAMLAAARRLSWVEDALLVVEVALVLVASATFFRPRMRRVSFLALTLVLAVSVRRAERMWADRSMSGADQVRLPPEIRSPAVGEPSFVLASTVLGAVNARGDVRYGSDVANVRSPDFESWLRERGGRWKVFHLFVDERLPASDLLRLLTSLDAISGHVTFVTRGREGSLAADTLERLHLPLFRHVSPRYGAVILIAHPCSEAAPGAELTTVTVHRGFVIEHGAHGQKERSLASLSAASSARVPSCVVAADDATFGDVARALEHFRIRRFWMR